MTLQDIKRIGEFDCNVYRINMMCAEINRTPQKVYEIMAKYGTSIGVDSYTRESIFNYIADKYHNGNYNIVYNKWLNNQGV